MSRASKEDIRALGPNFDLLWLCSVTDISHTLACDLCRNGIIPAVKLAGEWRIKASEALDAQARVEEYKSSTRHQSRFEALETVQANVAQLIEDVLNLQADIADIRRQLAPLLEA